jgi:superfamily I DNA/RNA helicase
VKAKLAAFVQMIDGLARNTEGKVAPLVERVFKVSGLEDTLKNAGHEGHDAVENIEELISTAAAYDEQAESPSLVDYLQQIALFSDADAYDASNERVALMTLHAAKGLEFENVFIIGLEHGSSRTSGPAKTATTSKRSEAPVRRRDPCQGEPLYQLRPLPHGPGPNTANDSPQFLLNSAPV